MSRSYRKFPRKKFNRSKMKTIFNRSLRRKINDSKFDSSGLSGVDYKKVNESYEISDMYPAYPLQVYIEPTYSVRGYTESFTMHYDENGDFYFREEGFSPIDIPQKVSTKYYDLPPIGAVKNPYMKGTLEYKLFNE